MSWESDNPTKRILPEGDSDQQPAVDDSPTLRGTEFEPPDKELDRPALESQTTKNLADTPTETGVQAVETEPMHHEEETRLEFRAEDLIDNVRHLPPGRMRLEAISQAFLESTRFRERLNELELTPAELTAVALNLAEAHPPLFAEMVKYRGVKLDHGQAVALARHIAEDQPQHFGEVALALKLTDPELTGIIKDQPGSSKERLIQSIGVREVLTPATELTRTDVEYPEGQPDDETLLRLTHQAEAELTLALAKERPEQAERQAERDQIAQELLGEVDKAASLGGTNAPLVMTFQDRMLPAAYKPRAKEFGLDHEQGNHREIRPGIPPGSYAGREWLAYQIDRALGTEVVPPTVLRDGPEGVGSVQDWKVGVPAAKTSFVRDAARDPEIAAQLERVALFDVATVNCDRHDGNWVIGPDKQHHAFDNGFILAGGSESFSSSLRSWPLWAVGGRPLSESSRELIKQYQQSEAVRESLRQCFAAALGEQADELWDRFNANLDSLLTDDLPADTEWDDIDREERFRQKQATLTD